MNCFFMKTIKIALLPESHYKIMIKGKNPKSIYLKINVYKSVKYSVRHRH
jgi:hypothetical protein